tara:strand:- start:571 stop:801 length:231 start_codon:yes stop_codon:yes gene_type:complete
MKEKVYKTRIKGYNVEVKTGVDYGDGQTTEGYISKGNMHGSIERASREGLYNGNEDRVIPDYIMHKIEDWAYSVGY